MRERLNRRGGRGGGRVIQFGSEEIVWFRGMIK